MENNILKFTGKIDTLNPLYFVAKYQVLRKDTLLCVKYEWISLRKEVTDLIKMLSPLIF